jgi:hypothetical protein
LKKNAGVDVALTACCRASESRFSSGNLGVNKRSLPLVTAARQAYLATLLVDNVDRIGS